MVYCVAYNCKNEPKKGTSTSFHKVPSENEPKLRKQWLDQIRRVNFPKSDQARVCSDHFTDSCYEHPQLDLGVSFRRSLKKDAVPTVFNRSLAPPSSSVPVTPSSANKRQNRRILKEAFAEYNSPTPTPLSPPPPLKSTTKRAGTPSPRLEPKSKIPCTITSTNASPPPPPKSTTKRTGTPSPQEEPKSKIPRTVTTTKTSATPPTPQFDDLRIFRKCITFVDQGINTLHILRKNTGTQTDICGVVNTTSETTQTCNEDINWGDCEEEEDDSDEDWSPEEEELEGDIDVDDDFTLSGSEITDDQPPTTERKYIVFESCLRTLLAVCAFCSKPCRVFCQYTHGTLVAMRAVCEFGHVRNWLSQPVYHRLPLGNLFLGGGIMSTGGSATQMLRCLSSVGIVTMSKRTYSRIQSAYLNPAIERVWLTSQDRAIAICNRLGLKVGGDARCCSPGHSAKYSSYSLMDLQTGCILDIQLIQVTEVANSNAMELEGLQRSLAALTNRGLVVTDLTTDRHPQVKAWMKKWHPEIRHWFDTWHVAKGIFRKIKAKSKLKLCDILAMWAHSVSNHCYWCAASSDGDGELVLAKWLSVLNHVVDVHTGHGDHFPECEHERIDRLWLTTGSKAHKELAAIVGGALLKTDIQKLSPLEQTSQLEAYHSTVCRFAPKFLHFHYAAMKSRLFLAGIHTNENAARLQATTKSGELRYNLVYPKFRDGEAVAKPVKTPATYTYINNILVELMTLRQEYPTYSSAVAAFPVWVPPPLSSKANKIDKNDAIKAHKTRYPPPPR